MLQAQPAGLSFEQWMAINYPNESRLNAPPVTNQAYNRQQFLPMNDPSSRVPPSGGGFESKMYAGSRPERQNYGKGTAISNLFDPDPSRAIQQKMSRQNGYRRELEEQIESRNKQGNDVGMNRQKSLEYLQQLSPLLQTQSNNSRPIDSTVTIQLTKCQM